tara:strand:- start:7875 stop:8501 length:627 start_codon:yes stop_codon:yes gene_type:complete
MKKILIVSPHTDDGEFGCGGSIVKHLENGDEVYYIAFSICEESVPKGLPKNILEIEVKKSTKILGIKSENLIIKNYPVRNFNNYRQEILDELIKLNQLIRPNIVYIPSSYDVHQDHKVIHQESIRAFKNRSILGYEFVWNSYVLKSNYFSILSKYHLEKKIKSIGCYKSQIKRIYSSKDFIISSSKYKGLQVSSKYAEAFEIIRWVWN